MEDKKSPVLDFLDALLRGDWRALRRLFLGAVLPVAIWLFEKGKDFGAYQSYAWAGVSLVFIVLLTAEILLRPRSPGAGPTGNYTATIRGLICFGEDDAATFATLGRERDVARVVNAVLDAHFRFGVLFAESGCGKTSLLRAGIVPELKRRGYEVHVDDIDNREEPLDSVVRLLRDTSAATPSADGPPPAQNLLAKYDSVSRHAFLILDQFEQFFLHYGRQEKAEPFLSFLTEWWTLHPASQLRILVSIRDDYVGKLAVIQERLAYVSTIHNHLQLRKFVPEEAVEVLRVMAAGSNLTFHEMAARQTCREEMASNADGTISPVDLQILATGVRDLPGEKKGFTAVALRSLGGLQGALERYLLAQLSNLSAEDRKAALAILRLLSELKTGVAAGWLSAEEMLTRLGEAYGCERAKKMIAWLADTGVRLIVQSDSSDGKRYRLVHDRLVAPVLKVSGQVLIEPERASLLLDQRVREYLSNARRSRYLLPRNEWRLILRHQALLDWGGNEAEKRELLTRSGQRVRAWSSFCFSSVALVCVALGIWELQPKVLLWRTWNELVSEDRLSGDGMMYRIAKALATAGEIENDPKLIDHSLTVAQRITNPSIRSSALIEPAAALASTGNKRQALGLIDVALAYERQDQSTDRADFAEELATVGARDGNPQFVDQAITLGGGINNLQGDYTLERIAVALATAGEEEKDPKLIGQALAVADRISGLRPGLLIRIATALAATADSEHDSALFAHVLVLTDKIHDPIELSDKIHPPIEKSILKTVVAAAEGNAPGTVAIEQLLLRAPDSERLWALIAIGTAMVKVGEKRKDPSLGERSLALMEGIASLNDRSYALRSLAEALASSGDVEGASKLLDNAATMARNIGAGRESEILYIVTILARVGAKEKDAKLIDEAIRIANENGEGTHSYVLSKVAVALATVGVRAKDPELIHRALATAKKIGYVAEGADQNLVLVQVVFGLASLGNLREARSIAHSLPFDEKNLALAAVILGWGEGRCGGKTYSILDEE